MNPPLPFAGVLRGRRLAARLTQEQLADRAGLSSRTVGDIERGRVRHPRPGSARLLADALDLAGHDRLEFLVLARTVYWADRTRGPAEAPLRAASCSCRSG